MNPRARRHHAVRRSGPHWSQLFSAGPPQARPRHLGIVCHRHRLGVGQLRDSASKPHLGNHRRRRCRHPHRHSRRHARARASGSKDPQFVVIDEVAGQLVALIAVPLAWKTFLAGLILFRVFDIWKPFPIRRLERLPEGTGIVVDDLGAGLYALVIMHLLLHFGLLMK